MIDGGYIYLDNSDVNKDASVSQDDPNFKTARQILINYERTAGGGGAIEYFLVLPLACYLRRPECLSKFADSSIC